MDVPGSFACTSTWRCLPAIRFVLLSLTSLLGLRMIYLAVSAHDFVNFGVEDTPMANDSNDSTITTKCWYEDYLGLAHLPTNEEVLVLWTYPKPPKPGHSTELKSNEILFCSYRQACPDHWESTSSHRLNLRQLTQGTPYFSAVMKHALLKVQYGKSYPDHVQSIALLSSLHHSLQNYDDTATHCHRYCVRSWGDEDPNHLLCPHGLNNDGFHSYSTYHPEVFNVTQPIQAPLVPANRPDLDDLHFNTFRYPDGKRGNSGDEMQDLTAIQFLPFVSDFVSRDFGWKKGQGYVIANAWYGNIFAFPPKLEERMHPTFISMHVGGGGVYSFQSEKRNIQRYFRDYYTKYVGPVGARDAGTLAFLQSQNISSYLSRCMTLMHQFGCDCIHCASSLLPSGEEGCPEKDLIVVNDVSLSALPPHVQLLLKNNATFLQASLPFRRDKDSFPRSFEYAFDLLETYARRAKVVITSRLHSALPALAVGTPVIFVDPKKKLPGGGGGRMTGILEILNVYQAGEDWSFDLHNPPSNPGLHVVDRNRASLWKYLKGRTSYYEDAAYLHGMIPMRRLGPQRQKEHEKLLHSDFYFLPSGATGTTWQFSRVLESVFYHHPNAHIHIYTTNHHHNFDALINTFYETGYQVSLYRLDMIQLLRTAPIPEDVKRNYIKQNHHEMASIDPNYKGKNGQLQLLLVLLLLRKAGGVFLREDMLVLQPLSMSMFTNHAALIEGSLAIMGMEPLSPVLLELQKQLHHPAPFVSIQSVVDKVPSLTLMSRKSFDPFHKDPEDCYISHTRQGLSHFLPSFMDNKTLPFARVDSSLWSLHNRTLRGTPCDDLLYRQCIFCNEIHSYPALGE